MTAAGGDERHPYHRGLPGYVNNEEVAEWVVLDAAPNISEFVHNETAMTTACLGFDVTLLHLPTDQTITTTVALHPNVSLGALASLTAEIVRVMLVRRAELAAAGPLPEPVLTECPGCGRQLHGPVAERGACLDCFPEVEA
jgi:hypothetical protein